MHRYYGQRQLCFAGCPLDDMVQESISFIKDNAPPDEPYFVGFSGGKDSCVTLALMKMAGVKFEAYYSCTTIDPPEMYKFIRKKYPEVQWLYPKTSFYDTILKRGIPLRMVRWCCDFLKKDPSKHIPLMHRIMGIRAEESIRRAKRPRIGKFKKQTIYKPIFHWTEWQVWEFIETYNIPYSPLYDEGFNRIGCVVCPFIMGRSPGKEAERQRSMDRYPHIWEKFRHAIYKFYDQYEKKKPWLRWKTAEEFWQAYLVGFE